MPAEPYHLQKVEMRPFISQTRHPPLCNCALRFHSWTVNKIRNKGSLGGVQPAPEMSSSLCQGLLACFLLLLYMDRKALKSNPCTPSVVPVLQVTLKSDINYESSTMFKSLQNLWANLTQLKWVSSWKLFKNLGGICQGNRLLRLTLSLK